MLMTVWRLTGLAGQIVVWLWREHRKPVLVAILAFAAYAVALDVYEAANAPTWVAECFDPLGPQDHYASDRYRHWPSGELVIEPTHLCAHGMYVYVVVKP